MKIKLLQCPIALNNPHQNNLDRIRQRLFSLSPQEATFSRRGFRETNAATQSHLEKIGKTVVEGYNKGIAIPQPDLLTVQLNKVTTEFQGFAYEGAGMALTLLDNLLPWTSKRVPRLLEGAGNRHIYVIYVGIGWGLAKIPGGITRYQKQLDTANSNFPDPLLGWLAIDGYGFHQGFFQPSQHIEDQQVPKTLRGYSLRAFDQGLGRCLWFVDGGDVQRIPKTIRQFPTTRQGDLWSGIGLAVTYAGGVEAAEVKHLQQEAGDYLAQLAQGATFAAKTRLRAENISPNTEMACQIICKMSALQAAEITDITLEGLTAEKTIPAYEVWRRRIQAYFERVRP